MKSKLLTLLGVLSLSQSGRAEAFDCSLIANNEYDAESSLELVKSFFEQDPENATFDNK